MDGVRGCAVAVLITTGAIFFAQVAPPSAAQAPVPGRVTAPPPRDAATPAPAGQARLAGRVISGATKQPIYRAIVQLSTGNLQTARWTSTDGEGRWSFADVQPGSYTVTASRDGFVSMALGQHGPYGTPIPLAVSNTLIEGLDIILPRGGVVTGRVTDERGDGLGLVLVQAMRVRFVDGMRQLVEVRGGLQSLAFGGLTDDRGEYRLYGLAPGTYYLAATYGQIATGTSADRLAYATTYAPGTALVAEATPIAVVADKVVTVDVPLVLTRVATVSGTVVTSTGAPSSGAARLGPIAAGHAIQAVANPRLTAQVDAAGRFIIRGVPAGNYYLYGGPTATGARGAASGTPPADLEAAVVHVSVSGEDIRDLLVQTAPTGSIAGQLRVEGDSQTTGLGGFFVRTRSVESGGIGELASANTNASGAFSMSRLLGRLLIRVEPTNLKPGWWLKSVSIDGVDVTDTGYDFRSGQVANVSVVVTQRMGSISGVVRDASNKPTTDFSVVAFAQDESRWTPYTRFIASAGPRQDGSFKVDGLPAGDYVVVAVPPIEAGDETNPERLKAWRAVGRTITLADAQAATIALTLAE